MITLRAFGNAAEAAMAKSLLDDRGISCSLADEASHLYGGAPSAMPVRLLVREDQAEEALRILDTPGEGLPDDFDVMENAEPPSVETPSDVALELQNLRQIVRRLTIISTVLFLLLWCFVAYLLTERPTYTERLWSNISFAMHRSDFETARRIAHTAVKQYPREYWSHEWLAMVDVKLKDFASAEAEYQRAYELLPAERIKKHLQEVRNQRESKEPTLTGPTPTP